MTYKYYRQLKDKYIEDDFIIFHFQLFLYLYFWLNSK